jgi:hypothetical protein
MICISLFYIYIFGFPVSPRSLSNFRRIPLASEKLLASGPTVSLQFLSLRKCVGIGGFELHMLLLVL